MVFMEDPAATEEIAPPSVREEPPLPGIKARPIAWLSSKILLLIVPISPLLEIAPASPLLLPDRGSGSPLAILLLNVVLLMSGIVPKLMRAPPIPSWPRVRSLNSAKPFLMVNPSRLRVPVGLTPIILKGTAAKLLSIIPFIMVRLKPASVISGSPVSSTPRILSVAVSRVKVPPPRSIVSF